MASEIVYEDDEVQVVRVVSATPLDEPGGWSCVQAIDKPGSPRANAATLRQRAAVAMAGNRTYLALATPTAAQTTAQVKALTRQMNAVIRLLLNDLEGTD